MQLMIFPAIRVLISTRKIQISARSFAKLHIFKTTNIKIRSTPKYSLTINFDNKIVELTRISQILNIHFNVVENLHCDTQNKENTPMVMY